MLLRKYALSKVVHIHQFIGIVETFWELFEYSPLLQE